jgi:hypothetical protein
MSNIELLITSPGEERERNTLHTCCTTCAATAWHYISAALEKDRSKSFSSGKRGKVEVEKIDPFFDKDLGILTPVFLRSLPKAVFFNVFFLYIFLAGWSVSATPLLMSPIYDF